MANARFLLLCCGVTFLFAAVAMMLVCFFRRSWRRRERQLTALILFLVGAIAFSGAFKIEEIIGRFVVDGITVSLAIIAIAFAFWQFADSREQQKEMTTLAGQMATRFAGFFPKNLHEIYQVVSKAEKRLDVMSDYVAYGHYSAPRQFDLYFRKLLDLAIQGVEIRMLVYSRDMAEEMHERQFISDSWRKIESWERLKQFCKRYENNFDSPLWQNIRNCDAKVIDWNNKTGNGSFPDAKSSKALDEALALLRVDFDHLMWDRQLLYMKELLERGIEIRKTDEKLPFFMWCEDRHEAVFAFLHETSKAEREVSFQTRDSRFIADSFERKFEYLWEQSEPIKLINVNGQLEPDWLSKGKSLLVVPRRADEKKPGAPAFDTPIAAQA